MTRITDSVLKFLLTVMSLIVGLVLFEVFLASGIWDNLGAPRPVWTPPKYVELDRKIDHANQEYAKLNPHGFTDSTRTLVKGKDTFRIAVLGDSFIWGDGIPHHQIWSHKLEKILNQDSKSIEVLSWGINGWSTLDEFEFLKSDGVRYNIDYLIVGYVTNDPDMGDVTRKRFKWHKSRLVSSLETVLPNAISFIYSHVNAILEQSVFKDHNGPLWRKSLYSDKNLEKYLVLLESFSTYCKQNNIPLLFVLTPNNHNVAFEKFYEKIIPLLDAASIEHLNLYPMISAELGKYSALELRANRADGHPGSLVTEVYANEVAKYLKSNVLGVKRSSQQ